MHKSKRWNIALPNPAAEELAGKLKASPLLAQVLLNRGVSDPLDCATFLRPSLKHLYEPSAIAGLVAAAERISKSIRDKQRIVIYGDYDVDGITASAILWHAITVLGGTAEYYVPHRIEEGYGLNKDAIAQICDQGAQLIITVDCGITAIEPAKVAADRGVDMIITDHHEWKESEDHKPMLPQCAGIVHPRLGADHLPSNAYPNPHLCGAGVAFKLAWGLGLSMSGSSKVSEEFKMFLCEATALAGLGTIADVVPLVGENRTIAHFGLGGLKQTKLRGLKALIESAGLTGQNLDSYDVGFKLAPRLNACGRMGHARLAVEMLTKAGDAQAMEIAVYLEQQNRARQTVEKKILDAAMAQATELELDQPDCHGIVLGGEGWHPGVIGIVASRVVDKFHRPTIMIAINNDVGQGSGRSIAGFHLTKALEACKSSLETFGGHEMAAGLKMKPGNLNEFREAFADHARQVLTPELLTPELPLEASATLRQFTPALVADLHRLGPFGHANRRPLLACHNLEIATIPRRVGKTGDHLQLHVRDKTGTMKCIAFGYGNMFDQLTPGVRIELAVEPTLNEYNGRSNVELEVKDLKLVGK